MAHDAEKFPTATQQVDPSNPAEDPVHPTWVEAAGYEPTPDTAKRDSSSWTELKNGASEWYKNRAAEKKT